MFKLNRAWKLAELGEVFKTRPIPQEELEFDGNLTDELPMKILFDKSAEYLLIEEYGPESYTLQPNGMFLLERGYTNFEYTVKWILSFGGKAQVLQPQSLRDEVIKAAKAMLENYNTTN